MLQVPAVVVPFVMCDWYNDTDWYGLLPRGSASTLQYKPLFIKTEDDDKWWCEHEDHPKDALASCQQCSFPHPEQTAVEFIAEYMCDNGYLLLYSPSQEEPYDGVYDIESNSHYTRNGRYFTRNIPDLPEPTWKPDQKVVDWVEQYCMTLPEPEYIVRYGYCPSRPIVKEFAEPFQHKSYSKEFNKYLDKMRKHNLSIDRIRKEITRSWHAHSLMTTDAIRKMVASST